MMSENNMGLHAKGFCSKNAFLPWRSRNCRNQSLHVLPVPPPLSLSSQYSDLSKLSLHIAFKIVFKKFIRNGFQQEKEDVRKEAKPLSGQRYKLYGC